MMQLRSRGSPRNAEDYTEDIYIIDFDGDGQDVKLLTKFEFSEAFSNRFANQPLSARHLSPLGKWAKELLWNGFQKVVASVSSGPKSLLKFIGNTSPWAVAFDVIANYSIGGLIECYIGPAGLLESFLNHILDTGFRGALTNVVEAFGDGITSSIITSAIGTIIQTSLSDFKAKAFFKEIAIGTVLNLIFTSNNVEKLKKLVGNVRTFVKDLVDEPKLIKAFWENRRLVNAWESIVKHADLRKNVNFLENIADFSDDLLLKLDVDLLNPNYTLKELFLESPADVKNIWKKLKDDPAFHWEILDDGAGFVAGSRWDKWSKREFFKFVTKKGKDFENVVTTIAKNGSGPPFNGWLNDGFVHHGQLHIENLTGGKRIIGDDVFIKNDIDDLGVSFKRAIYHDSKLSSGSPWTPNQRSELIDIFSNLSLIHI
jgi:hypothetical protein